MRHPVVVVVTLLLAACATASDIKPGVVRGLDDRGYLKTTEGFAIAVRGCPDAEIWHAIGQAVATVRVSDSTNFWRPRSLTILDEDQSAGVLRARDDGWLNAVSYVGIYVHRPQTDLRLIEVTAFWQGRSVVLSNPWEAALLDDLRTRQDRLAACVVSSAEAERELRVGVIGDKGVYRAYPTPTGRSLTEPSTVSDIFCRRRADEAGRDRWLENYRRCMAGY